MWKLIDSEHVHYVSDICYFRKIVEETKLFRITFYIIEMNI